MALPATDTKLGRDVTLEILPEAFARDPERASSIGTASEGIPEEVQSDRDMDIVRSKNGVSIRLPDQRWAHITEEHCEMAGRLIEVLDALANPEQILEGPKGELLAVKPVKEQKYMVVVYKELSPSDGFVITAFLTRQIRQLERRSRVWPR